MIKYYTILDNTQNALLSLIVKLGPFLVALMPALFIGLAVYREFAKTEHIFVALSFAVIVPFAIESVGIISSHSIVELFNGWREGHTHPAKLILVGLMGLIYVVSVSGVIYWAKDAFASIIWALGLASPIMAYSAYIATNLLRDHLRASESKAEERQRVNKHRRDENARQRDHKRALEMRALEHKQALEMASLQTVQKSTVESIDSPQESIDLTETELDCLRTIQTEAGESTFNAQNFQEWTGRKRAYAFRTLKRATEAGYVSKKGTGKYIINGRAL